MPNNRIYKDDLLITKPIRLSPKYEIYYVKAFIDILRQYRDKTVKFVEENTK